MSDRIEQIEGHAVRRTGWMAVARRCPVHGGALELCVDEIDRSAWSPGHQVPFNHHDNRIRWRCEGCVGSWLENHFLDGAPRPLRRLRLSCPACGSPRVTHECVAACCERHICIDCHAPFDARADVVVAGVVPINEPYVPCLDTVIAMPGAPALHSGVRVAFRRCERHDTPLELVFLRLFDDEPADVLGWHCAACDRAWSEGSFRAQRRRFVPDAQAAFDCACGGAVVSFDDGVRCARCHATMAITLVPRGGIPER